MNKRDRNLLDPYIAKDIIEVNLIRVEYDGSYASNKYFGTGFFLKTLNFFKCITDPNISNNISKKPVGTSHINENFLRT